VNRLFLSAGTALAFLLAAAFRWLTLTEFLNDHFDHVALAQQLRLGALPVRDFVDEGMPLMYAISAAAWSLINAPFLSEAIIVALAFAIAAALSFRVAARLSRSMLAAALAVIAQVAIFPRTYSYPKLLVQAVAIAVACWAVRNLTTRRIAALSAATALGYYFRHDHAVYLGVAIVTLLVIVQWPVGMRAVVRTLVLYAALAAAFVLPHLLYVQWAAGIPTYVAIARQYLSSEAASAPYQIPVPYLDTRAGLWIRRNAAPNNVRWAPSVDDQTREALEQRYHMDRVEHDEGTTWRYHIRDTSPANLRAIQNDPHVEDTDGFNRLVQARSWRSAWRLLQLEPGWRVQENSLAVLFWLSWLLPVAAIALLVARRRDHSTADAAVVAMLAVLAFFTDVAFLRAPLHVRLPDLAASHRCSPRGSGPRSGNCGSMDCGDSSPGRSSCSQPRPCSWPSSSSHRSASCSPPPVSSRVRLALSRDGARSRPTCTTTNQGRFPTIRRASCCPSSSTSASAPRRRIDCCSRGIRQISMSWPIADSPAITVVCTVRCQHGSKPGQLHVFSRSGCPSSSFRCHAGSGCRRAIRRSGGSSSVAMCRWRQSPRAMPTGTKSCASLPGQGLVCTRRPTGPAFGKIRACQQTCAILSLAIRRSTISSPLRTKSCVVWRRWSRVTIRALR
jgi:hypothetical protein